MSGFDSMNDRNTRKNSILFEYAHLWARIMNRTIRDLQQNSNYRDFRNAALYFFTTHETEESADDIRTFDGICSSLGMDADTLARRIFKELPSSKQIQVLEVLQTRERICVTQDQKSYLM